MQKIRHQGYPLPLSHQTSAMKQISFTNRLLLAAGLLLLVLPFFLQTQLSVADYQRGLIVGVGLGLEVLALLRMQRSRL